MIGCIFIIVLNSLFCTVVGMQHEAVALSLQNLIREIPVLCINNYIVNVSSAYEGLKKERFLNNDFIKSIKFDIRNCLRKDASITPFRYAFPANRHYIQDSRPTQCPNFLYVHALCLKSSQNEKPNIELFVFPFVYMTDRGEFRCIPCSGKKHTDWGSEAREWLFNIIGIVAKDMIKRGRKGKYGVELCYNNRISDWLIVEKNC